MSVAKFQPVHAVVNNAPMIISVMADQAQSTSRFFYGIGGPSGSTLLAGNGKYNAALHGWIISGTLNAGGTGYAVNDSLTVGACTIIVDSVAAGVIVDFHVSAYGNYSGTAYPTNPVSATGGTGTGATFNLNFPSPDFYLDMTNPATPAMYVCTAAGTNNTASWATVTGTPGTGGYAGTWSDGTPYGLGMMVRVMSTAVVDGVTPVLGVYGCVVATSGSGSSLRVPTYPEPVGHYWELIAFGVQTVGVCTGTSQDVNINASGPF